MRKAAILFAATTLLWTLSAHAQDEPSLGDVARQARQQKQQKPAQLKPASTNPADSDSKSGTAANASASKEARVISNENLFEQTAPATISRPRPDRDQQENSSDPDTQNAGAEEVRSAIESQKSAIASLKDEIESLSNSIHYAGGNCVANCAQWNERQKEKQDEVERMKGQLDEQEKRLEEMQESARKQGFGSSVYEP